MDGKKKRVQRDEIEETSNANGKKLRDESVDAIEEDSEEDKYYEDPYEDDEEEEEEYDGEEGEGEEQDGMDVEGNPSDSNWKPVYDKSGLEPGQKMEYDSTAYIMFHSMSVEWPCLSFDVIPDKLGSQRSKFPITAYAVTGTQAESPNDNKLLLLKMSQLNKTKHDDDESDDDSDSDDEATDDNPLLEMRSIPHPGGVNRVRCMTQEPHVVATWSEQGYIALWDISKQLSALDTPPTHKLKTPTPIFKTQAHKTEGYSLDWSANKKGRLISGDCSGKIFLTDATDENASSFAQNASPFAGHKDSVEDLQWSPVEETVFASCSVDKTIKVWDIRQKQQKHAFSWQAGSSDINVISWKKKVSYLLVSGCDDGSFKVWDLRTLKPGADCTSIANFTWHTKAITSVSWDPNDESVIAVASEDDSVTLWDLSTERDEEESHQEELANIPPQLLFVHQNQTDIKELHFHPQLPGVIASTAMEGFDIFKPNIAVAEDE